MDDFEFETELSFAGNEYLFTLAVVKTGTFEVSYKLVVDCEEKLSGDIWRGEFLHRYIEEITAKAKNPKQFPVFVKMLLAGLKREANDEIVLDLLTQFDLEQMKKRKQSNEESIDTSYDPKQKKYIILTLKGQYEKTHYPLPLAFLAEPDINTLRRTFTRMQSLVQMRNSNTFSHISYNYSEKRSAVDDFVLIETENQQIRRELDSMEQVFSQTDTEFFKAAQEQIHQTSEFEQYRLQAEDEIAVLGQEVERKENELMKIQRELNKMRGTKSSWSNVNSTYYNQSEASTVKSQLDTITTELENERKKCDQVLIKQLDELEEVKKQHEESALQQKKMKARMAELQVELEQTIKRIETIQRGGFGYGARANRPMNFSGSQGSRNSSKDSRNNSNTRQPVTGPYSRPSQERQGLGARSNSNTRSAGSQKKDKYLPSSYKPPHQRVTGSANRISPVRGSGYGPQPQPQKNRVSPGRPLGQVTRVSPNRYANVPSRLYQGTTSSNQNQKVSPVRMVDRNASEKRNQSLERINEVPSRAPRNASNSQQQAIIDRLYQKAERTQNEQKMPPRIKQQTKPVSVNISSVTMNKENNAKTRVRNDSRGPVETKRTIIPSGEEIEGQDIDQKLNRLQDLLRMAKGSL